MSVGLKSTIYVGGLLGLSLLVALIVRADFAGILRAFSLAGWQVFWLLPYRVVFFLLYAIGWDLLLRPYDPQRRLTLVYLTWVATVREAIDRLLPVASVGGGLAAVRLLGWRGVSTSAAAASVIVEVLLTLVALWAFMVIGLSLLTAAKVPAIAVGDFIPLALGGLAVPAFLGLALRYGTVFARLEAALRRWVGLRTLAQGAASLDADVRASLRRVPRAILSGALQLGALLSGSFEVWFSLRLFGHPVDLPVATIMESLTQVARHVAFLIPGALGIQELSLIVLGNALGVSAELALAVSLVKRARELLWGIPALISWQWEEGRRLHRLQAHPP
jgi:putative membrane protein